MEFQNEELIKREIKIGSYLLQKFSLTHITEITGLSKKIVKAHYA